MSVKLLIIEDNPQDQKIISRYLSKAGFDDVTIVANGEKGVEKAEALSPDIILLDTMLPGMDGFETCYQLKKVKNLSSKVIMMTGSMDAVDAEKARKMGANDYCVKTSDCATLLEALDATVARPSSKEAVAVSLLTQEQLLDQPDSAWGLEKTRESIKALYKELEKKNEKLKELDNLKSEFVSTVSHELRTPLTIIKGAVSQTLQGIYGEVTEEQRKKLSMALRNADLLKRIIDDLLDVAKLEAKKVALNKDVVNLVALAKEVHHSFLNLAQEKGIEINLNAVKPTVNAVVDRGRIVQVLTNLVGNALKFTDKGSIEISVSQQGQYAQCIVKDTGRGISREELPDVFNRFQQFGRKFGSGQEGTGLGLSICKNIVELHGGKIYVESQEGKGSSFIFELPVDDKQ